MRRIQRLKSEAREGATLRKHNLSHFTMGKRFDAPHEVWDAVCKACGMCVQVNTHPSPNQIDIGGEAVALDCTKGTP